MMLAHMYTYIDMYVCAAVGTVYRLDSNILATLLLLYNQFLSGCSEQKLSVRCMSICPQSPYINQFKPHQQIRQQALRAYCPNVYTVQAGTQQAGGRMLPQAPYSHIKTMARILPAG